MFYDDRLVLNGLMSQWTDHRRRSRDHKHIKMYHIRSTSRDRESVVRSGSLRGITSISTPYRGTHAVIGNMAFIFIRRLKTLKRFLRVLPRHESHKI